MRWADLSQHPVFRRQCIVEGFVPAWIDLLPQFESDAVAEKMRRKVRSAIAFNELDDPVLSCGADFCGSGLCPRCVRLVRRNVIDFGWNHRLSERRWNFVTIRFANGWKQPGDLTRIEGLGERPDVRAFLTALRMVAPALLVLGSVEAIFHAVGNRPKGVNFHLHAMISGVDEATIRRAADVAFDLEKIANPVDVLQVEEGEQQFLNAWSYTFKQPFWKRSRKDDNDRGKRSSPSSKELRQLCANYGAHQPRHRLFAVGFELTQHGMAWPDARDQRVRRVELVPPTPRGIEDGQPALVKGHRRVPRGHNQVTRSNTGDGASAAQTSVGVDPADSTGAVMSGGPDARITIVEKIVVEESGEVLLRLRFPTPSGMAETELPRKMLGEVRTFRPHLLSLDAAGDIDFKGEADRLLLEAPQNSVVRTSKAGWRGDTYVCELGVFGAVLTERVEFAQTKSPRPRSRMGTLAGHRKVVDRSIRNSDILAVTYLAALAPPLMMRIGELQGFAVHLVGESTTGKTLAQRFGQSAFARSAELDLVTFDQAPQAISATLSSMSGTAIAFKDLKADSDTGKVHMDKLQRLMFAVHSGDARQRSNELPLTSPQACVLLLSDEVSLTARFDAQRKATESGTHVRVLEIPVPDRKAGGIFARIGKSAGKKAAKAVEDGIRKHHGMAFEAWIDALVRINPSTDEVETLAANFVASRGNLDAYETRVARPLGLLAATAQLAKQAGLVVSGRRFLKAISRLFPQIRAQLYGLTPDVVQSLKLFATATRDTSVFPLAVVGVPLADHQPVGFVRKERDELILYIRPDAFRDYFPHGADARIREILHRAGTISKPANGWTASVQQAGMSNDMRCMKVKVAALRAYVARLE